MKSGDAAIIAASVIGKELSAKTALLPRNPSAILLLSADGTGHSESHLDAINKYLTSPFTHSNIQQLPIVCHCDHTGWH